MSLLDAARISARRRPAAVLFVFLWQLVWSLVVATPVHAFARRVWGAHPEGDAVLWSPGGRELLVWLAPVDTTESVVFRVTAVLFVLGVVLAQIPLGVLLASLVLDAGDAREGTASARAPSLLDARRASAGTFMSLLTVLVATSVIQGVVLAIGAVTARGIDHALVESMGDARAIRVALGVGSVFGAIVLAIGVVGDLMRAAVVIDACGDDPSPTSLRAVWRALRRAVGVGLGGFARAATAWSWRGALSVALIGAGAAASSALGGRGGVALLVLFAAHQLVTLVRTALRASWLARAARAVSATPTPAAGTEPPLHDDGNTASQPQPGPPAEPSPTT